MTNKTNLASQKDNNLRDNDACHSDRASKTPLLPCPFCGEKAFMMTLTDNFAAMCRDIPYHCVEARSSKSYEEAAAIWNRRVS